MRKATDGIRELRGRYVMLDRFHSASCFHDPEEGLFSTWLKCTLCVNRRLKVKGSILRSTRNPPHTVGFATWYRLEPQFQSAVGSHGKVWLFFTRAIECKRKGFPPLFVLGEYEGHNVAPIG